MTTSAVVNDIQQFVTSRLKLCLIFHPKLYTCVALSRLSQQVPSNARAHGEWQKVNCLSRGLYFNSKHIPSTLQTSSNETSSEQLLSMLTIFDLNVNKAPSPFRILAGFCTDYTSFSMLAGRLSSIYLILGACPVIIIISRDCLQW